MNYLDFKFEGNRRRSDTSQRTLSNVKELPQNVPFWVDIVSTLADPIISELRMNCSVDEELRSENETCLLFTILSTNDLICK